VIPAGITVDVPFMTIDLLPSLAHITGASLPTNYIDGKNAWDVIVGESSQSPQEAYYFYYHQNELHAVLSEGWKLYLPHRYRTLGGREGGKEGLPVDYEYVSVLEPELYNINQDIGESMNVASENSEIVSRLMELADGIRMDLGDKLLEVDGTGRRPAGEIQSKQ
jgi:arylsulfatase